MTQAWTFILVAAMVSYFLRALPFFGSHWITQISPKGKEALEGMSYAIIGGLVSDSLGAGSLGVWPRWLAVLLAFVLAKHFQRPTLIFYSLLGAYCLIQGGL